MYQNKTTIKHETKVTLNLLLMNMLNPLLVTRGNEKMQFPMSNSPLPPVRQKIIRQMSQSYS